MKPNATSGSDDEQVAVGPPTAATAASRQSSAFDLKRKARTRKEKRVQFLSQSVIR